MRGSKVAFVCGLVASSCASSEDAAETAKKRCAKLRDHLIELRLADANDKLDVKAHRAALQQALGGDFVDRCAERPAEEIKCATAAKDTESVAACSTPLTE